MFKYELLKTYLRRKTCFVWVFRFKILELIKSENSFLQVITDLENIPSSV